MFPVAANANPVAVSQTDQPSPSRVSAQETDAPALWSQWQVTEFPQEVLSHIFSFLGCDDVRQVHNTCQKFRDVVRGFKMQVLTYSQLPGRFRRRYQHSLPWQKGIVQNARHPFINRLPDTMGEPLHEEQQAALLCLRTLASMRSTPAYFPVKVCVSLLRVETPRFSQFRSTVVLCKSNGSVSFLEQEATGLWREQLVKLHKQTMKISGVFFSPDGEYSSALGFGNKIVVLKRATGWGPIHIDRLSDRMNNFTVSASGQYLMCFTETGGIDGILDFDTDQERWQLMVLVRSFGCEGIIQRASFSPSERHLVVEYAQKLVMIARDERNFWIPLWETPTNGTISYTEFSVSGRWLLVACKAGEQRGSVVMIRLDRAGQRLQEQVIAERYLKLTFSPFGTYLVSQKGQKEYLLWRLGKSGQWRHYGELTSTEAPLWPELGPMNLNTDAIAFSPCDKYLLTSNRYGLVHFWGQDEQENWTVRGSAQHYGDIIHVAFSPSGAHALTVDSTSIRIWGCNNHGLWSVKGRILATLVLSAEFHPTAEHLIVFQRIFGARIWELRKDDSD